MTKKLFIIVFLTFTGFMMGESIIFKDNFSSNTGNWFGGIFDNDGYAAPGSLKIIDTSSEAGVNAISNPIQLDKQKSYQLSCRIKTNGKVTSYSCIYLMIYDAEGNFVAARESNMVKSDIWERARILIPKSSLPENAASYRIMLQAAAGVAAETGTAWFDEVELKEFDSTLPNEFFPAGEHEQAYTDKLFIKASSSTNIYMNPSALLTDGDRENFWQPSLSDNNPALELSHGKKEFPARLVISFASKESIPANIKVSVWDDDICKFAAEKNIIPSTVKDKVAVFMLADLFPATRKLKIIFPHALKEHVSELRYFITPQKRENWHAFWIWLKNQNSTANYEEFTTRAFRFKFNNDKTPVHAVIQARGDDMVELFLNGHKINQGEELKDKLLQGENVLAAIVTNERYAAGLLAEMDILNSDGSERKIISDANWKTTLPPFAKNWNQIDFNDSSWVNCEVTARPPFGPWGEIPYTFNSKRIPLNLCSINVPDSIEAGKISTLNFDFSIDSEKLSYLPLSLQITKNNEIFYNETIAEKDFFRTADGNKKLSISLKLNEFIYPGDYKFILQMPFHDIIYNGKPWSKTVKIINNSEKILSKVEIVTNNGTSQLLINNKINNNIWYTFPYTAGRNMQRLMSREFGKANCNIAQVFAFPVISSPEKFDFTVIDRNVYDILDTNPAAFIILKLQVNQIYPEFAQKYPGELCTLDNEKRLNYPSHASKVWLEISGNMLKKLIEHIRKGPYADRIIGYFILSGEEGQWFHHWGEADPNLSGSISDYSPAMLNFFRDYLRKKYTSVGKLQKAWNKTDVNFNNAEIPSRAERIKPHNNGIFRNSNDIAAVDFGEALSACVNQAMGHYAEIVKKETANNALFFAYYGHLMDVGDGFLAELGGYLKQQELLQNPDIDGFAGPLSYRPEFRDIGGTSSIDFPPSGSTRLNRKITIQEDDLRTHLFPKEYAYTIRLPWQSISVLAREVAKTLCDGTYMYLHEFGADYRNWFDDPEYLTELKKLNDLRNYFAVEKNIIPRHEIAVITDDHTLNFLNQKPRYITRNVPETRAIYMRETIGRIGAPFTEYLLSSFTDSKMPAHKLYIFLNTYKMTKAQKKAVLDKLAADKASALFLYAPGIIENTLTPDVSNMTNLLGMNFEKVSNWQKPLTFDFKATLNGKTVTVQAGMPSSDKLDDFYVINDPEAETLGTLTESNKTAFAVKKFNGCDMYFASFPFFSTEILRYIAVRANVHIYTDSDDAFYRAGDIFAIHPNKIPGKRTITLPSAMTVRQVYPDKTSFEKKNKITFESDRPVTRIYEIKN